MKLEARDIIVKPVISEKSYSDAEKGKYTFIIAPNATKPDIRRAVEQIWGVKVRSVNTMYRRGKEVRRRFVRGMRPGSRRAIVTLAPGEKISIFET
ncbi:MAG: 50S ribosomal protein L23 [Actinomycetota bacterium]